MRALLTLSSVALIGLSAAQPTNVEAREGRRTAAVVGAIAGFAAGAAIASAARPSYYGGYGYYGSAPAYAAYPTYGYYAYPAPRTYTTTRVIRYEYVQSPYYGYGGPVYYGW